MKKSYISLVFVSVATFCLSEKNPFVQPTFVITEAVSQIYSYDSYGMPSGRISAVGASLNYTGNFDSATGTRIVGKTIEICRKVVPTTNIIASRRYAEILYALCSSKKIVISQKKYFDMATSKLDMATSDKVSFISFIIPKFASGYKMNTQKAYLYLKQYGGIDYLNEHWWALHTDNPVWWRMCAAIMEGG